MPQGHNCDAGALRFVFISIHPAYQGVYNVFQQLCTLTKCQKADIMIKNESRSFCPFGENENFER